MFSCCGSRFNPKESKILVQEDSKFYYEVNDMSAALKEGEVNVKVAYAGLTYYDAHTIGEGKHLGSFFSGTIQSVGAGCEHWKAGDKVYGFVHSGAVSQVITVNKSHIHHLGAYQDIAACILPLYGHLLGLIFEEAKFYDVTVTGWLAMLTEHYAKATKVEKAKEGTSDPVLIVNLGNPDIELKYSNPKLACLHSQIDEAPTWFEHITKKMHEHPEFFNVKFPKANVTNAEELIKAIEVLSNTGVPHVIDVNQLFKSLTVKLAPVPLQSQNQAGTETAGNEAAGNEAAKEVQDEATA